MPSPPPDSDYHGTVEQYTPDGTVGRLLFGLLVGGTAVALGLTGLLGVATGDVLPVLAGAIMLVVGLAGLAVALTTLWPVYLSLIGNVESPEAYSVGADVAGLDADPETILKRRYAAGEISREAFERRLDELLDAESRRGAGTRSHDSGTRASRGHHAGSEQRASRGGQAGSEQRASREGQAGRETRASREMRASREPSAESEGAGRSNEVGDRSPERRGESKRARSERRLSVERDDSGESGETAGETQRDRG